MNEREYNIENIPDAIQFSLPKSGQEERRNRRKAERTYKMRRSGFLYLLDKQKSEEPRSYTNNHG